MVVFYMKSKYAKNVSMEQKSVGDRSHPERAPPGNSHYLRNKLNRVIWGYNPEYKETYMSSF